MDELERKVQTATSEDAKKEFVEQMESHAARAWKAATGLEPAYVEIIHWQRDAHPRVFVMVDGIKIGAFINHSSVRGDFQQWDIAETFWGPGVKGISTPDLSLPALAPYLRRRRKRLKRRGLYNG